MKREYKKTIRSDGMLNKELISMALMILVAIMICINYKLNEDGRIYSMLSLILVLIALILYFV